MTFSTTPTDRKIPNDLITKIRQADANYKLVPAKDLAIIALNHLLYELKRRKKEAQ